MMRKLLTLVMPLLFALCLSTALIPSASAAGPDAVQAALPAACYTLTDDGVPAVFSIAYTSATSDPDPEPEPEPDPDLEPEPDPEPVQDPDIPTESGDPDDKGDPDKPGDIGNPDVGGDSDKPGDINDPEDPTDPTDPTDPSGPEIPDPPVDPSKPADPETPEDPAVPDTPAEPESPSQPPLPDRPEHPLPPYTPDDSFAEEPSAPDDAAAEPPASAEVETELFTGDAGETGIAASGVPLADLFDVDLSASYAPAVASVCSRGLMTGVSAGRFSPEAHLNRAMMAQILYNLAGRPSAPSGSAFSDTPKDRWFAPAVSWAAQAGMITGSNGRFAPEEDITREQMALLLYRCALYLGLTAEGDPAAAPSASPWAAQAMAWAVGTGLLEEGCDPGGFATRGEAAVILERFCQMLDAGAAERIP